MSGESTRAILESSATTNQGRLGREMPIHTSIFFAMKKRNGLSFVLAIAGISMILPFAGAQNCPVTVNAGGDATLCAPGNKMLSATVTGGAILSSQWTPATGLTSPASLNTTANVSATTTYSILVRSPSPTNLVVNGNFNQGDTGFDTDYNYDSGAAIGVLENEYAIVSNSGLAHNQFADCDDHTGDNPGNMMTVNGSGQSNNVWCQTITIQANTEYLFSAWACSAVSQNPARLRFSINGIQIGNVYMASSSTCNWTQFSSGWTSTNATTATICIVNVNTTASGNDFSLDDISFRQVCQATDEVTVTVANLDASWNSPGALCTDAAAIDLNSLLNTSATPNGTWTLDGMPATTLTPAALSPGGHSLRYTVTQGSCSEELTQAITIQPARTAGQALPAQSLCSNTPSAITLANLLQGEDPGGAWSETSATSSSGGAFNAASGSFNTANQTPGSYTFRYFIDATAPCSDVEATVTVVINPVPVADAGADQELDCTVTEVPLGGPNTSVGMTYNWSDGSGVPLNLPASPMVDVTKSATYTLTVTNPATGCSATDQVMVVSTFAQISAELTVTQISCSQPNSGAIEVVNASGGEGPYLYQLGTSGFVSQPLFSNLTPGDYAIVVQDVNGCETTLMQTLSAPSAIAVELSAPGSNGAAVSISLGDSIRLTALANIPLDQIASITWTPAIPGCTNCPSAVVQPVETTTYLVVVTDLNGCSATDELTISLTRRVRLFIPNAFSPNDDGYNDRFVVNAGNDVAIIKTFRVWNRWGGLLFEQQNFQANDPNYGWDGKARGQMMTPGVYVYSIEFELLGGEVIQEKGDVSLVR